MYFPEFYLHVGNVSTMTFIIPILQVIMFGMGTQISLRDFQGVVKQPHGVVVGLLCQFTIMPLVGYFIAVGSRFEPEIAAGIILIGSVPCGIASNVMNFIAKSNMALSVTLTAVATLIAPLATLFFMKALAGHFVEIEYLKMTMDITSLVILPIMGGLMFQTIARRTVVLRSVLWHFLSFVGIFLFLPIIGAFLLRTVVVDRPVLFERFLSLFSMIGLLLTIVIINAAGRDHLLKIGVFLIFACLLHNLLGFLFGYWLARLFGLDERSCQTVSIEVGLQNESLASAVFGPLMNITGSSLATWATSTAEE